MAFLVSNIGRYSTSYALMTGNGLDAVFSILQVLGTLWWQGLRNGSAPFSSLVPQTLYKGEYRLQVKLQGPISTIKGLWSFKLGF